MSKLLIFDIKPYALHDGGGIRTTLFLKGCPLRCLWCHNPESCRADIHIFTKTESFKGKKITKSQTIGKYYDTAELLAIIEKDQILYDESGGGLTLSGGEPLMQAANTVELLQACRERGIHTCLDTSGYAPKKHLELLIPWVDEFLFDLKIINDEKHKYYTGVSNRQILGNVKMLDGFNKTMRIRIPFIPKINDSEEDIKDFIECLSDLNHSYPVDVLPYHKMGSHKVKQLLLKDKVQVFDEPSKEQILTFKEKLRAAGFQL